MDASQHCLYPAQPNDPLDNRRRAYCFQWSRVERLQETEAAGLSMPAEMAGSSGKEAAPYSGIMFDPPLGLPKGDLIRPTATPANPRKTRAG